MRSEKFLNMARYLAVVTIATCLALSTFVKPEDTPEANLLIIAVATNFAPVLSELTIEFKNETNIDTRVITGSTGKLFAQIKNGMDIDVFLSADQSRIHRLVRDGMTIQDTLRTYAQGTLAWWQPGFRPVFDAQKSIRIQEHVDVVAFAQPELAPYGMAAKQALSTCFEFDRSKLRFVHGENAGQTFSHVATGNADAGLVALASIRIADIVEVDSYAVVPNDCHEPIKQDAVVLKTSRNMAAARQFIEFLLKERIQQRIATFGYSSP